MITKTEIDVQIALGTVSTPQQIAQLVKKTVDVPALEWAIKYKNTKVRAAAAGNSSLPVGLLLWACIFETSSTVRAILREVVDNRRSEILHVLDIVKHYPQLSMDLIDESTSEYN